MQLLPHCNGRPIRMNCFYKYSEIEKREAPCFFWEADATLYDGTLPHCVIQRCAVQFQSDTSTACDAEKDPIVTAGNNRLRFEGFSISSVYGISHKSMYFLTDTTENSWKTGQRM